MKAVPALDPKNAHLELADKWILHRFNETVKATTESLEKYDMDAASRGLYNFFWADFCDWYLEMVKPRVDRIHYADLATSTESTATAKAVLATVLEGCIKLLHPFIPFITEELWEKIPKSKPAAAHVMASSWPKENLAYSHPAAAKEMELLQEVVTKLRAIRSEMGIPPAQPIEVVARTRGKEAEKLLKKEETILRCLNSRVAQIKMGPDLARPKASAVAVIPGGDLYVPLEGLIDFNKERSRLEKELESLRQDADRLSKKMANQDFLAHAPAEEVAKAQDRLNENKNRIHHIEESIATLSS
jgi:valyl-tRNA synthetase